MTSAPPSPAPVPDTGTAPSSGAVIEATAVAKSFGHTQVLTDVTMSIPTGVTGLLGSNGAGKTTFMSLVLGLTDRTGGQLKVLGADPATAGRTIRQRIGYSPEHHHLPDDIQAADLVRHLAQLHGLPRRASTERASDALWHVGLGEERFRPIGTMSTGQRQRVKLAAAIAHDPQLVLLDEPTDGLDPVQRDDMLELIRRVGTEYGINVLLSSHLLEEVERTCDHVVILAGGVVTRSGPLSSLRGEVTGVVLELDSNHQHVINLLHEAGATVQVDGQRIIITGAGNLHNMVRDAVAVAEAGLRRLSAQQSNLQDIFLESNSGYSPTGTGQGGPQ